MKLDEIEGLLELNDSDLYMEIINGLKDRLPLASFSPFSEEDLLLAKLVIFAYADIQKARTHLRSWKIHLET